MSGNAIAAYFTARWRGRVSLDRLLWLDMILVGTALNLATTFVALMMLGFKAPTVVAVATHFAALPYNFFVVAAIWRKTNGMAAGYAMTARGIALAWFLVAILI
jgi:hypothetical protein